MKFKKHIEKFASTLELNRQIYERHEVREYDKDGIEIAGLITWLELSKGNLIHIIRDSKIEDKLEKQYQEIKWN